ncbi:hypothetical protein DRQ12_11260 [candidate division KSB1 bacterium]|nr:MAG: hypothetical protein DRQ12_11260 [candidate division KSB1 bacterium]
MRAILEFCDFEPTLRLIEKYHLKARLKSCISDVSKGIAGFEKELGKGNSATLLGGKPCQGLPAR